MLRHKHRIDPVFWAPWRLALPNRNPDPQIISFGSGTYYLVNVASSLKLEKTRILQVHREKSQTSPNPRLQFIRPYNLLISSFRVFFVLLGFLVGPREECTYMVRFPVRHRANLDLILAH